jgi:hypothetical protein
MRIQILSDLHLEFGSVEFNFDDVDSEANSSCKNVLRKYGKEYATEKWKLIILYFSKSCLRAVFLF